MGMDVFGKNPDSKVGEYFRANIWYWRPLWDYIEINFPEIACQVESPYTNEGHGLDVHNSLLLSSEIDHHLDVGLARDYKQNFDDQISNLPLVECSICKGSGNRVWPEGTTQDWIEKCNGCNVCHGTGLERPFQSWYHFTIEVLQDFSQFLRHCGGFEIW